jgi:hypothetical protein
MAASQSPIVRRPSIGLIDGIVARALGPTRVAEHYRNSSPEVLFDLLNESADRGLERTAANYRRFSEIHFWTIRGQAHLAPEQVYA